VDQRGRLIYVNAEDEELRHVAASRGVPAALRLIERRKRALPGIEEHIETEARQHRIDPQLVHAIIEVESAWNPRARSRKGALGLMQLLPGTAARFGIRDLYNPQKNVTAGIRYLRFLLDRFDNNLEYALAGYNAGENAIARAGGVPPYRETRQYVERLRNLYGKQQLQSTNGVGAIFSIVDRSGRVVYVNE
jgi:soluble lytic murein transglycosylase-like protein